MSVTYAEFVETELRALEYYDAKRPAGHAYAFHLHVRRVADDMHRLALAMGYAPDKADELRLASLAHDAGKRMLPVGIWDIEGKPDEKTRKMRRDHTWLGVRIVDQAFGRDNHAGFLDMLRDLMKLHHETMNGQGYLGLTGAGLTQEVRMLCVVDAFDGYSVKRPHFGDRDVSPPAVIERMRVEKAGQFDDDILAIFEKLKTA